MTLDNIMTVIDRETVLQVAWKTEEVKKRISRQCKKKGSQKDRVMGEVGGAGGGRGERDVVQGVAGEKG